MTEITLRKIMNEIEKQYGTVTLPAGDTSISVFHGISQKPNWINITPQDIYGLNNYVDNITILIFNINIQVAQGTDAVFLWSAGV